jgi:hypothetical protein
MQVCLSGRSVPLVARGGGASRLGSSGGPPRKTSLPTPGHCSNERPVCAHKDQTAYSACRLGRAVSY